MSDEELKLIQTLLDFDFEKSSQAFKSLLFTRLITIIVELYTLSVENNTNGK